MSLAGCIRKRLPVFAIGVFLAFAVAPGCDDESTAPPPPPLYVEHSSPANVLTNLRRSYEQRYLDEYDKLFSQDFIFVFNPADARDPDDPTPQQWGRREEMTATSKLFQSDRVEVVVLSWDPGEAERSDDVIPGSWRVRVREVDLEIREKQRQRDLDLRGDGAPPGLLLPRGFDLHVPERQAQVALHPLG